MTVDLSLVANDVRFALASRGRSAEPIHDESADRVVHTCHSMAAADRYVAARFQFVLDRLPAGPWSDGMVRDVRVALGEYDTLLSLQSEAAA